MKKRTIIVSTLVIGLVLVAASALVDKPPQGAATASSAPVATAVAPAASQAGPAATAAVLLKLSGTGIKASQPFTVPGNHFNLAYQFDCAGTGLGKGNFQVMVYDGGALIDLPVNELASSGKDTTPVYVAAGSYHVEVNAMCSWAVTITV